MNVNQLYDIINTHLLYHYAKLDKRYATLCVLVKAWAEAKQIADTVNGSFSGYTLNLLVLHYLMCATVPAVLPNLQQKYGGFFHAANAIKLINEFSVPVVGNERKKWKKKKDAERSESDPPSTKPTKEPEVNKKSVGYLLMGFFDYYSHFDFANQAVCITHGCCVASVNSKSFKTFIGVLRSTREALFSLSKTPCIGDIGLEVSDEDRIAARQLKKREEREIKAAHKSRTSSVTQPVAAAKQQKYSKETSKKAKAQREFTSPVVTEETLAKVEEALCLSNQRRREAELAFLAI
ncbi:PAP/25A associated domain containing protein [Aphelenchoides avenae]|nr:PAP/25A associated domain containing protein [Aphelenchus avenae]